MKIKKMLAIGILAAAIMLSTNALAVDFSTVVNPGSVNSASYTSIGLTTTVTPSNVADTFTVRFDGAVKVERSGSNNEVIGEVGIFRTVGGVTTNITGNGSNSAKRYGHYVPYSGAQTWQGNAGFEVQDAPNTTSAVTYEIKVRRVTSLTDVTIAEDSAAILSVTKN